MSTDNLSFPVFRKTNDGLYAITGPKNVVRIRAVGSVTGCDGLSIDFLITRRMVLKYRSVGVEISQGEFDGLVLKLMSAARAKMR